jgi:hypothetical protein
MAQNRKMFLHKENISLLLAIGLNGPTWTTHDVIADRAHDTDWSAEITARENAGQEND